MANLITKTYSIETGLTNTWIAPGGVTSINIVAYGAPNYPQSYSGHIGGLTPNGDVYVWGHNSTGKLGDNSVIPKSSPVLVVGGIKFQQISFGQAHSAGLDMLGRAWCWGSTSTTGAIGDNTVVDKSSPVLVVGGLTFKEISAGNSHTAAITTDGRAYCWGNNLSSGGLGDATIISKSSPVAVVGGLRFRQISAGQTETLGLTEQGIAYGWGLNDTGGIGDGTAVAKSSPVAVVGGLVFSYLTHSAGLKTSAGITTAGDLYMWGNNSGGKLGDLSVTQRSSPVPVVGGLKFKQVSVSNDCTIGLTPAGDAYSWGRNAQGELGQGNLTTKSSPVAVVGGLKFSTVFAGSESNLSGCAGGITTAGDMYVWGANGNGQLADGTVVSKSSPILVAGGIKFIRSAYIPTGVFQATVVPNTSYTIDFTTPFFSFAGVLLGQDINKIDIRYQG